MIVCRNRVLHANEPALSAGVADAKTSPRNEDAGWFHRAATGRCAVARVFIKMFAPETLWAVVGVAAPRYRGAALRADKVLFGANETHRCRIKAFPFFCKNPSETKSDKISPTENDDRMSRR